MNKKIYIVSIGIFSILITACSGTNPQNVDNKQKQVALDEWKGCLVYHIQKFDDGKVDPNTLSVGVLSQCEVEYNKFIVSAVGDSSTIYANSYKESAKSNRVNTVIGMIFNMRNNKK